MPLGTTQKACLDNYNKQCEEIRVFNVDKFEELYLYVLSLDGGEYYLDQTDNLHTKVEDHCSGKIEITSGRNPQLIWSEKLTCSKSDMEKRLENLRMLFRKNPDDMLHRLQARLPTGGIRWG